MAKKGEKKKDAKKFFHFSFTFGCSLKSFERVFMIFYGDDEAI
jgi:hypothetical protein